MAQHSLPKLGCALAFLLGMTALATGAQADETLDKIRSRGRIVVGITLPGGGFGTLDPASGKPVGFNVELAKNVADRLGVQLETVQVGAPNRVQFLLQGKVDILIATMAFTQERADTLGHVPTPYYEAGGAAIFRKDAGITKWEDLRGKPVCLSQGSNYAQPLTTQYGAEVKGFKGSPESLLALRGGNCAAAVHDGTIIHPLLQTSAEWADYQAPLPELIPSPWIVWTRKGEQDTIAYLDGVVKDWHKTGFLIETEKKLGISPPAGILVDLRQKHREGT